MIRSKTLLIASALVLALVAPAQPEPPSGLDSSQEFTAARVTLKEALYRFSKVVHTPLQVTEALASRPVVIYVREQRPRQAMDEIAWFFAMEPGKCYWAKDAEGSLTLREDSTSRKARSERTAERRNTRMRQLVSELKNGLRLGLLSNEGLSRESGKYPELVWAMPAYRRTYAILAALNPVQRDALLSGRAISVPVGALGAVEKEYAQGMIGGVRKARRRVPPELGGGWITFVRDRDILTTPLTIRLAGRPDRPGIRVMLRPLPGWQEGVPDLLHPQTPPPGESPDWLREVLTKRGIQARNQRKEFLDRMRRDLQLSKKVTLRAKVEVSDPTQPGGKTLRASDLADSLGQVADQTRLTIIGDYDPCWNDYYSRLDPLEPNNRTKEYVLQDLPEKPAWEVMELIAKRFQVEWGKRGKTIWVRSPRIPYALMDRIDVLDPPPLPTYWQQFKPGDQIPGVSYDP